MVAAPWSVKKSLGKKPSPMNVLAAMRIVSNLVSNGVKYTDRGRVLLGARRRPDALDIMVCDTGRGMTAAEIEDFRAEWRKGAASGGSGLGLAICHDLAARHGLGLTVRSDPGRGTVFTLSVPREASVPEVAT